MVMRRSGAFALLGIAITFFAWAQVANSFCTELTLRDVIVAVTVWPITFFEFVVQVLVTGLALAVAPKASTAQSAAPMAIRVLRP